MPNSFDFNNNLQYQFASKYYDLVFNQRDDIDFYLAMASRYGGPILEAGCGTGRIFFRIASLGLEITGFDISKGRLDFCDSKRELLDSKEKGLTSLYELSMVDFKIEKKFKLAIIPFRGFQHILDSSQQLQSLKCFAAHLESGGILVFDIFNPSIPILANESVFKEFKTIEKTLDLEGGEIQLYEKVVNRDYINQRIDAQEIYKIKRPNTKLLEYTLNYSIRYTFRYEIEYLLKLAGFTIAEIYSDFKYTAFGELYPGDIVIVAKKIN